VEDDRRQRALDLLKATHSFPGDYHLSVITLTAEGTFVALRAAIEVSGPLADGGYHRVPSSGGKYTSHRFRVVCASPEDVLALYERVRQVEGVVSVL
jgi:putative lipoic acid-binding regulatory protein